MRQEYQEIHLSNLNLDHENPRLPKALHNTSDTDIVNWLLTDASLIDLMVAIGTNNFFPGEPLLVVEEENGKYTVVEGNRRLASVMLLSDMIVPSVQKNRLKQAMKVKVYSPQDIPCIVFSDRANIEKYLGFRHVTGIKEWSPLAKARYLTNLIESTYNSQPTKTIYKELSNQIGSKPEYVKRLTVAYKLFELIESNAFFRIPDLNEESLHFTYLMDSLNRPVIRKFLQIDFELEDPFADESTINIANIEQLIRWFFEKNEFRKTVLIGDSTHLGMLSTVLENDSAKSRFLETFNIRESFNLTIDRDESFRNLLFLAKDSLEDAWSQSAYRDKGSLTSVELEYLTSIISLAEKIKD